MAKQKLTLEEKEERWLKERKRRLARESLYYGGAEFTLICNRCEQPAAVYQERDGACGDPDCCSQDSHIEFACLTPDCQTTNAPAEWRLAVRGSGGEAFEVERTNDL